MAFDFPNAPTVGSTYTPIPGGLTYVWSGSVWLVSSSAQIKTALPKNYIINPCGRLSQEVGTTGIAVVGYMCDQWVGSDNFLAARTYRSTGSTVRATVPGASASIAASNVMSIYQPLEGAMSVVDLKWGTLDAIPAVLRLDIYVNRPGTYTVSVRNAASDRSFVHDIALPVGWTRGVVVPVPADFTGTWPADNTCGMLVFFNIAAGSTYRAAASDTWLPGNFLGGPGITNNLSAANGQFEITNVGLYADPFATGLPPPWQERALDEDLDACFRYLEYGYTQLDIGAYAAGMFWTENCNYTVWKRATPAISLDNEMISNCGSAFIDRINTLGFRTYRQNTATGGVAWYARWKSNARM